MTNWQEVRLDDICKINTETYSLEENLKYVNYLDTGNITSNRIENIQHIDLYVDKLPSRARRKVKNGNIIYSTVRPNQLHYGLIKEQPDNFLVSTGFAVLDIDTTKAIPEYVYYSLTQTIHTEALQAIAEQSTSAYPSMKSSDIGNIIIPLPPLDIQKKIAGVLGALDDKIELNNKINNNLEQQAQALFKSWFVDFEPFGGTMPKDWKESDIYSISNIIYGAPFASKLFNTEKKGLPIIRIRDLKNQHSDTYTEEIHPKAYIIKAGDIVVGMDGEFRPYIWGNDEGLLNQRVCVFENKRSLGKMFLYLTIKPLLNRVEQTEVATTVIHIGKQDFDAFRFSMPSNSILDKFDAVTQPIYNKIVSNSLENTRLASLRDALLPKLMSGKIDVSEVDINELNAADMLL